MAELWERIERENTKILYVIKEVLKVKIKNNAILIKSKRLRWKSKINKNKYIALIKIRY
jgi:hypothetical protein